MILAALSFTLAKRGNRAVRLSMCGPWKTTWIRRIAADLRAILASHVALELVDRRRLRPADDIEGNRLMGVAAEALDLEIAIASIQRITKSWRGLGRLLEGEHAHVPSLARELVRVAARMDGLLRGRSNRAP
jgi:hypothetical protein